MPLRIMKHIFSVITLAALSLSSGFGQLTGITAETWTGLTPGKSILILQKEGISARAPNTTQTLAETRISGLPANSGTRLRGTLTPTVDDTFTFWVNGTDNVALWISEDGTPFTKRLIANHLGATTQNEWTKFPTQTSQPISLNAGVTYHIEAQVMTSVANGHLGIAWRGSKGNWALASNGATTTQSSTQWALNATNAINGDTGNSWNQASLTSNLQNSWLRVNFSQTRPLNKIVLINISQNQNRLSNFRLTAHDANAAIIAQQEFFTTSGSVGNSFTWDLPTTVQAASIRIQLLGNNLAGNGHLSLAEIQAYGPGPYETTRNQQIIPSAFLRRISTLPNDTNDNHLSDLWEQQTGLASSVISGARLEYGDPDQDGITNYDESLYESNPLAAEAMADGLTCSMWSDEATSSNVWSFVRNRPRFLNYPNETKFVPNIDDRPTYTNAGYRYRGYVTAPTTGIYRFWIAGTNDSELWLADGTIKHPATGASLTNRFGKRRLATGGYVTPFRDFDYRSSQRSGEIYLTAGQFYYIEVLQKIAQGKDHHISVAWQPPGQARVIIPNTAYTANTPDSLDKDDDNLPDDWETSYGLNPTNNGRTVTADGEYGDADNDGLTNLDEFQFNTNPRSDDTDGDGFDDKSEIQFYNTNPLISNMISYELHKSFNLNDYADSNVLWRNENNTVVWESRRGWVDYQFDTDSERQGVYEINLDCSLFGSGARTNESLPLVVKIDDTTLTDNVYSVRSNQGLNLRLKTPWLSAGSHKIRIQSNIVRSEVYLQLRKIEVKKIGGSDLNGNQIPDWIEQNYDLENYFTRFKQQSKISPVCIQGIAEHIEAVKIDLIDKDGQLLKQEISKGVDNGFYTNIILDANRPTAVKHSLQNGFKNQSHNFEWVKTNILADADMVIRKNDSLKLAVFSNKPNKNGNVTLFVDDVSINSSSVIRDDEFIEMKFDKAGNFKVTGRLVCDDGSMEFGELFVRVVEYTIPQEPTELLNANTRVVRAEKLPVGCRLSPDKDLVLGYIEEENSTTISALSITNGNHRALVTVTETNDVLAHIDFQVFNVYSQAVTAETSLYEIRSDGPNAYRFAMIEENMPSTAEVRLNTTFQGAAFYNGSRNLTLKKEDFDQYGKVEVNIEFGTSMNHNICHQYKVFIVK